MEIFGLFDFLRNLLGEMPASEKKEDSPTAQNTEEKTKNSTAETRNSGVENPSAPAPSQDAILRFLSDHDERVSRSKKPR